MDVRCKCGCGKVVQRGSNYFLQQSLGLRFGVEIIDIYHQNYLTRIDKLDKRIDVSADLDAIKSIRNQCIDASDAMWKVAHEGPVGLILSRDDVYKLNLYVIQFIWRMEELKVPELAKLGPHVRMSKPQQKIYRAFLRSLNSR